MASKDFDTEHLQHISHCCDGEKVLIWSIWIKHNHDFTVGNIDMVLRLDIENI